MKQYNKILIATALMMSSVLAFAHGDHDDELALTKEGATSRGDTIVKSLVSEKKLPGSWQKKQLKNVESRFTPAGVRWVVGYDNADEKDPAKRTIYILLDGDGNYVGNNHTGKL